MTQLFDLCFNMGMVATLVFSLLLLTRALVKYPVTSSWRYGELKLVLLLFLIPFTWLIELLARVFPLILLPFSYFYRFYPKEDVSVPLFPESTPHMMETFPIFTENLPVLQTEVAQTGEFSFHLLDVVPYGFVIGVFFLSCRHFLAYQKWNAFLSVAKETDPKTGEILQDVQKKLQYPNKIELLSWDLYDTPLLTGVLKPKLLLTKNKCSPLQYEKIFFHEVTHLKNNDHWWNFFLQLALLLHFYNPLIYLFGKKFREEMEFACDEKVVESLGLQEKKEYFYTLLESASLESISFGLSFSTTKKQLERRMKKMLDLKNMKTSTKMFSVVLMTFLLMGAGTPILMSQISPYYSLEKELSALLLEQEYFNSVDLKIYEDKSIYIRVTPNMTEEDQEHCYALVMEAAEVRQGYVQLNGTSLSHDDLRAELQLQYDLQTSINVDNEEYYTKEQWDYFKEKVERGEAEFFQYTPEEKAFLDFLMSLDYIPSTYYLAQEDAPFEDPMSVCTTEEKIAIYTYCMEFSNDRKLFATWSEGSEQYPIISCYHKDTEELMVTEDKGVTWEAKDHVYNGTSRLEEDKK